MMVFDSVMIRVKHSSKRCCKGSSSMLLYLYNNSVRAQKYHMPSAKWFHFVVCILCLFFLSLNLISLHLISFKSFSCGNVQYFFSFFEFHFIYYAFRSFIWYSTITNDGLRTTSYHTNCNWFGVFIICTSWIQSF